MPWTGHLPNRSDVIANHAVDAAFWVDLIPGCDRSIRLERRATYCNCAAVDACDRATWAKTRAFSEKYQATMYRDAKPNEAPRMLYKLMNVYPLWRRRERKSTRLNSSHHSISY